MTFSQHTQHKHNYTRQKFQIGSSIFSDRSDIWQSIKNFFTMDREPQITEEKNIFGKLIWKVYDPTNDRYSQFQAKEDVLAYLEERHHRRSQTNGWDIEY